MPYQKRARTFYSTSLISTAYHISKNGDVGSKLNGIEWLEPCKKKFCRNESDNEISVYEKPNNFHDVVQVFIFKSCVQGVSQLLKQSGRF